MRLRLWFKETRAFGLAGAGLAAGCAASLAIAGGCKDSEHGPPQFTGVGGASSSAATFANASSSTGFSDKLCDGGLTVGATDAVDGARAIGICTGIASAEWVRADGAPLAMGNGGPQGDGDLALGHGLLAKFGTNILPREGSRMLALSSGSARNPSEFGFHSPAGWWKDDDPHETPDGYPKPSPSCAAMSGSAFDSVGLRVTVQPPTTAKSLAYDFNFYTFEFPDFVCTQYNDFFVALMTPTPMGLDDANISFDGLGNTISVNAGFLKICAPQVANDMKFYECPKGPNDLAGTGFDGVLDNSASTGWLTTTAPIEDPSQPVTLQFAIWDAGDGQLDSTVLIDNFRFEVETSTVGTEPVP